MADLWPGVAMFSFDNAWEAAPGTWTFAILGGGKVLAEQAFDVVAPGPPASPQDGDCGAPTS